tara:strand:- start:1008 stop:1244 length:237 start_codon:yes stop_codon:yes gene_type:complete
MKNNFKINEILEKLKIIEKMLKKPSSVDDYISEREAKKLLTRGTTWFWEQRKKGLPFFKLGAEVYYKKSDLLILMKSK